MVCLVNVDHSTKSKSLLLPAIRLWFVFKCVYGKGNTMRDSVLVGCFLIVIAASLFLQPSQNVEVLKLMVLVLSAYFSRNLLMTKKK